MQWGLGEAAASSIEEVLRRLEIGILDSVNQELFGGAWERTNLEGRKLLAFLAAVPQPLSAKVLIQTPGSDERSGVRNLDRMAGAGLIEKLPAAGKFLGSRYTLHPLVRAYVHDKHPFEKSDIEDVTKSYLSILENIQRSEHVSEFFKEISAEYDNFPFLIEVLKFESPDLALRLISATENLMNIFGRYEDRLQFCTFAADYFETAGEFAAASHMQYAVSGTLVSRGDPEMARAHANKAIELGQAAKSGIHVARGNRVKSLAEYLLGMDQEAEQSLAATMRVIQAQEDKECQVEALFVTANLRVVQQDFGAAIEALKIHADLAASMGWDRSVGYAKCLLARVYLEAGEVAAAEGSLEQAATLAQEFGDRRLLGRVRLLQTATTFRRAKTAEGLAEARSNLEYLLRLGLQREAAEAKSQIEFWSKKTRRIAAWIGAVKSPARYAPMRIIGV